MRIARGQGGRTLGATDAPDTTVIGQWRAGSKDLEPIYLNRQYFDMDNDGKSTWPNHRGYSCSYQRVHSTP